MYIRLLIIPLLLLCTSSCSTEEDQKSEVTDSVVATDVQFNKAKWRIKEGKTYPFRDQMLDDVVYNDTIRTLNKGDILELLGEPDKVVAGHLYYTVSQRRLGTWPLSTKTMVIKLTEHDSIEWIKIHK